MPDDTLTLRQAFDEFVAPDVNTLAPATIAGYDGALRRWEKITDNPPVGEIDNRAFARFRDALSEQGLAPATVNSQLRYLRRILRRIGPPDSRNPAGEGVISRIPYARQLRVDRKLPRIASREELSRLYHAAASASWPERDVEPADWWRAFIVTAYNVGPRLSDIKALRSDHVSFEHGTIHFVARKTGKLQIIPANRVTLAHLKVIDGDRPTMFGISENRHALYRQWKSLKAIAGITQRLTFHDLRRTAGSAYANAGGLDVAATILGHSVSGVTAQYYVNPEERVRIAADQLQQPDAFLTIYERNPDLAQMTITARAEKPRRIHWRFTPRSASYRGRAFHLPSKPLAVLQMLVSSHRPVTADELLAAVWHQETRSRTTVKTTIAQIRESIRRELRLPPDCNPIPRDGDGWTICLPDEEPTP